MRLNDARLNHGDPPLDIDLKNRVHVLGEVEYERSVAGLAGERGAAAARQYGNMIRVGEFDRVYDVALVTRDDHADGHAAVIGGISRIKREASGIKAHLRLDRPVEFGH